MRVVNRPAWYVVGGVLAFALGVYLTAYGYGWLA